MYIAHFLVKLRYKPIHQNCKSPISIETHKDNDIQKGDFIPMINCETRLNQQVVRYVVSLCQLPQSEIEEGARWLKNLLL